MRLIRFGPEKNEKPGILGADGQRFDLSAHFTDWDAEFFEDGGLRRLSALLRTWDDSRFPLVPAGGRWGPPVARPGKLVCIGLNYSDHARESGMLVPSEPVVFLKAPNTVVGPFDPVYIPRSSTKTDWEIELGVIIGKEARYLATRAEAASCVLGYCVSHDVSEREFQLERGGRWTKGKSCDHFNPLGPWLAAADEIPDPQSLSLQLRVNGAVRQKGHTSTMIFDVQ